MSNDGFARLDIVPTWSHLNDNLIRLVEYVPADRMSWSPKPELWTLRRILVHVAGARDTWLSRDIKDDIQAPDPSTGAPTRADLQLALRRTWERLAAFLRDPAKLEATYTTPWETANGHWIAFHALEHDIHHRADIFHYLALLGIETPDVGTP